MGLGSYLYAKSCTTKRLGVIPIVNETFLQFD